MNKIKTRNQVRVEFERRGDTFAAFARREGFTCVDVYRVMNGILKGRRGRAHEIAVKLGLKEDISEVA